MASFDTAYNLYIKPNEGGYANIAADKGGETYAGIARNYFPNWSGWVFIDFIKRTKGAIPRNTIFHDIDSQVTQFYRDWWDMRNLSQIKSQEVANLLFDYNVNSGVLAIKAIQRLVGVNPDGSLGPATIAAINKMDPAKLHDALKAERLKLYESLVQKDPTQQVFWSGWMARLNRFPTLVTTTSGIAILVGLGLLFAATYYLVNTKAVS